MFIQLYKGLRGKYAHDIFNIHFNSYKFSIFGTIKVIRNAIKKGIVVELSIDKPQHN